MPPVDSPPINARPRILFVSDRACWPPYPGFKSRANLLLESLAAFAEVTAVVVLGDDQTEPAVPPHVRLAAAHVVHARRRSVPAALAVWARDHRPWTWIKVDWRGQRPLVQRLLDEQRFDAVVAIDTAAWDLLPDAVAVPVLVDFDDLQDRKIALRRAARREYGSLGGRDRFFAAIDVVDQRRWARLQRRILDRAAGVTVCSEDDRALLGRPSVSVVPNGYRRPSTEQRWAVRPDRRPTLLFVGSMGYRPNSEAAEFLVGRVLPLVRAAVPDVRVRLVGNEGEAIASLGEIEGVDVVGSVDDMAPELLDASVCVVPLLSGGGTRIKILEAFAYGLPVVSTTVGAEGLGATDGQHLRIGDGPEPFAAACVELLRDPERAAELAANASDLSEERYTPEAIERAVHTAVDRARATLGTAEGTAEGTADGFPDDLVVPPVVCFAGQDWSIHGRAHCDFQVMSQLARARPVLVINSTGLRLPTPRNADRPVERIVRKLRSMRHPVTRPLPSVPGLVLLTPLGLPPVGIRSIDRLSTRVIAAQVSRAARRLGIRDPWVVSALPTSQEVTEHLGWRRVVYYRADDHAANPGVDRAGVTVLEDALMARAATVLYSSRSLMERESGRSGAIAVFFDHGVDLEHFRPRRDRSDDDAIPAAIAARPHPRIGFFGHIDHQSVDLPLIERCADAIPEASFVLIGPAPVDAHGLAARPNVTMTGPVTYEDLPSAARAFDIAIMPMPTSTWIAGANPIKLKEYLALGLPVVSTPCEEAHRYGDLVSIAADAEDFVVRLRAEVASLADGPSARAAAAARRRAAVADSGWDRRAAMLVALLAAGDRDA